MIVFVSNMYYNVKYKAKNYASVKILEINMHYMLV